MYFAVNLEIKQKYIELIIASVLFFDQQVIQVRMYKYIQNTN